MELGLLPSPAKGGPPPLLLLLLQQQQQQTQRGPQEALGFV